MLLLAKRWLPAVCAGGCVVMFALGPATEAQGCGGHHGGHWGYASHGGYGPGSYGGYGGPMAGGYGGTGGAMGSQSSSGPQQGTPGGAAANQNDPATALTYSADLGLTDDQVQRLEKMAKFGTKHAGLILTAEQKKKLRELVGPQVKSRSSRGASAQGQ